MWRVTELEKIKNNKSLTEEQRKKALKETLDKEIDLLQTIDRLKISAGKDQKVQKIQKYLKAMSDPKQWVRYFLSYSERPTAE
jgi:predicted GTPase